MRDINLLRYLPTFVQEFLEIRKIMEVENPEFVLTNERLQTLKDNQYIKSSNEDGIARFEKILKIVPSDEDTLKSRIARVMIRWNDVVPYTSKVLMSKLYGLCDGDFEFIEKDYNIEIKTHLDVYGQMDELENIADYMMPANMEVKLNNTLNYDMFADIYFGVGKAVTSMFNLTDSYKTAWTMNNNISPVVVGSGTCEVEITDSFKNKNIISDDVIVVHASESFTEEIEVTDSFKDEVISNTKENVIGAIAFTDIV